MNQAMIDKEMVVRLTGEYLHVYVHPERDMPADAAASSPASAPPALAQAPEPSAKPQPRQHWMERLKAGLKELEMGRPVSGEADPKEMSSLDRDLLKDSLTVVKRFKATLRQRFRLDAL